MGYEVLGTKRLLEDAKQYNFAQWSTPYPFTGFVTEINPTTINAQTLLSESLELPIPEKEIDEAAFLQHLADVVDYWMQHRMEQLMSLCYTLDVNEVLVAEAFHPNAPEPANVGLARLLYARQCQRLETKRTFKPEPLDDENAW